MKRAPMAIDDAPNRGLVLPEMLNELKRKAYILKFRREATCLFCFELQEWIMPEHFNVDESYYFEDRLNPDEDRVLYAISLAQGIKGFLVDACSVYTDNISTEMMRKLKLE
jgi:hypothetical protein